MATCVYRLEYLKCNPTFAFRKLHDTWVCLCHVNGRGYLGYGDRESEAKEAAAEKAIKLDAYEEDPLGRLALFDPTYTTINGVHPNLFIVVCQVKGYAPVVSQYWAFERGAQIDVSATMLRQIEDYGQLF